jgi:hypothetical protein
MYLYHMIAELSAFERQTMSSGSLRTRLESITFWIPYQHLRTHWRQP